jgi:hypothetical protein
MQGRQAHIPGIRKQKQNVVLENVSHINKYAFRVSQEDIYCTVLHEVQDYQ